MDVAAMSWFASSTTKEESIRWPEPPRGEWSSSEDAEHWHGAKGFVHFDAQPRHPVQRGTRPHVCLVHRLCRLGEEGETVVFGMDKIVSGGWESRFLPTFLAGEQLLLVVYGDVTAGVDLGRIDASSISVNGRAIDIRLPEPEIFATRVDNERTRVYSRRTGLFTAVDPHLESEVRKEAEQQIRQSALDGGVLRIASANARATMTTFLRGLGFEDVEVQ